MENMSRNTISGGTASTRILGWPVELEVELGSGGRFALTADRLESLTTLLNAAEGVSLASAEAHSKADLVRVCLTVEAVDPYDAFDRVCVLVRDRVSHAGLGPAVLVGARAGTTRPAAGWRMG